jgi:PadR family transcriptional regulator, regulatory protein PadR
MAILNEGENNMVRGKRGWGPGHGRGWRERHSPLQGGLLLPALLFMIYKKRSHGYDLLDALERYRLETVHPSMVYRVLREMEENGWVISNWDTNQTQGPARRVYELTDLGREAVQTWANELKRVRKSLDDLLEEIEEK